MASRSLCGVFEAGGTKVVCAAGYGPLEIPQDFREVIPTTAPAETLAAVIAFFERIRRKGGALGDRAGITGAMLLAEQAGG